MSTNIGTRASSPRSYAILTDVTLCIGCEECVAACKTTNDTGEDDAPWMWQAPRNAKISAI